MRAGVSEPGNHGGKSDLVIDPEKCTECVGAEDEPQCKLVCPAECIVQNPDYVETKDELVSKYEKLHA